MLGSRSQDACEIPSLLPPPSSFSLFLSLLSLFSLSTSSLAHDQPPLFASAAEVSERRQSVVKITTGAKAVDTMMGGGINTQSITEVFGEFRTGKVSSVTCQLEATYV